MTIKQAFESTMRSQWMDDCPPELDIDQPTDGCKRRIGLLLMIAALLVSCAGVLVACWPK